MYFQTWLRPGFQLYFLNTMCLEGSTRPLIDVIRKAAGISFTKLKLKYDHQHSDDQTDAQIVIKQMVMGAASQ